MLGAVRILPYIQGLLRGKKGVDAVLKAKQVTDAAKGAVAAGTKSREGLRKAADFLVGKELMDNKGALAWRLGPDALFAGINAGLTPGDPMDKGIAFTTDFALSGLGGLGAGRLARQLNAGEGVQYAADTIGSIAGGFSSFPATDSLLRIKGGGLTPYEKMAMEQQELLEQQIREQVMREMGYTADSGTDPFMYELGLAS